MLTGFFVVFASRKYLLRSWSGLFMVFSQSWDQISKHYLWMMMHLMADPSVRLLVVTKSNGARELAHHEVNGGWKCLSLYAHPIFIFIHYMKENETSCTQYDTPTKNRFIGAVKAGKSVHEAGHMFGIKKSSADRIWKRYETSGNLQNLRRSGRPKEVSDRTKRLVVWTAVTNHIKPFCEIANTMLAKNQQEYSPKHLSWGWIPQMSCVKGPIPYKEAQGWLCAVGTKLQGVYRDWMGKSHLVHECHVYIGDNHGKIYVTWHADEVLNEACLVPTFKQSSVCVMVWACIMKGRKGLLIVLEYPGGKGGGMNSARYKDQVLEGVLASFHAEVTGEMSKVYFQQDRAASHCSKLAQKWFLTAGIPLLYHPPSSPDLNPIEPVWHELQKVLHALPHPPTSVDELCHAVRDAWDLLPISDIDKHIDTMQEHVQDIWAAKGGHTWFYFCR